MIEDEQTEMNEEAMIAEQEAVDERIESFANSILRKRSEAVEFRANSGVERRWRISEQLIDFASDVSRTSLMDTVTGNAPVRGQNVGKRSQVTMNVVRSRCETAEGRFADVMLPVDDKNWGLRVTPNPTMSDMEKDQSPAMQSGQPVVGQDGQPASMADVAVDIKTRAENAMAGMEKEIDDQLVECDYNGESRKLIASAVRLGTGIMKGPFVVKAVTKKWVPQYGESESGESVAVHVLVDAENNTPASKCVSPWNVYPSPDCGDDVSKCSFIWEKDTTRPRDVHALIGLPGYNESQLQKVLEEAPKRTIYPDDRKKTKENNSILGLNGGLYEIWEYHGDVSKEDMELMGCECVAGKAVSACVVFINDRAVKAEINTLDTGDLPYDFFQWTKLTDDPWGIGEPFKMMWGQRVIDAAWRAMMDNAGDSAGVNIVLGQGIEPDDGIWEITGKKIWRPDGTTDVEDVRKAFAQFQITNNQDQLQKIIELALRFLDLETATPTIFQGEGQEAPETLGATNIMVDSSNISFRARAKRYDDQVTKRHLRRYYDFNMQYSKNEKNKGDFNVDPRGVSVLYEKDQQAQTLLQVFALKGDPDIAALVDWPKAIKQFFASRRLNILKDDDKLQQEEQAKAQQPPQGPPNPNLEVAQVRVQGEMEKAKLVQSSDMAELQFKAQQADLDRQHEKDLKEMDYNMKLMEYSERKGIEIDKLKVQLALSSQGMNMQRELADKKVTPQIATPPTEPEGQARPGEAYQA